MTSCPNCGFDLDSEGRCVVCGYGSSAADLHSRRAPGDGARNGLVDVEEKSRESNSGRSETGGVGSQRLLPLLSGIVVLLLLLGAGGAILLRRPGSRPSGVLAAARRSSTSAGVAKPLAPPLTASSSAPMKPPGETRSHHAAAGGSHVKISRVGFAAPVGASPVAIRATHPVNLYNPARQPVYPLSRRSVPPLTSEAAYLKWMLAHTHQKARFLRERWHRARLAAQRHLVVHRRVVIAFLLTPREWFVRRYNLAKTYENTALPIGYGQTISGPDLVMHMTDALDPKPDQKVLEIGTGSGYQSALLSQLSNYVYTIEIVRPLAKQTNQIYLDHTKQVPEYANIHRRLADGYYGWPAYAPFDRIIVTTGIDHIPPDLLKELKPGGIMVIPIGPPTGQTILKITKSVDKQGHIHLTRTNLYPGVTDIFVPFTASGGGTHNRGGRR